jgi:hypothetical protein
MKAKLSAIMLYFEFHTTSISKFKTSSKVKKVKTTLLAHYQTAFLLHKINTDKHS